LADYFETMTESTFAVGDVAQLWRPRRAAGKELLRLHAAAIRLAKARPDIMMAAAATHAIEQQLIEVVVKCLSGKPAHEETLLAHCHQAIMIRLEEVLQARPDHYPNTRELTTAIGVSERRLRPSCQEILGMSPSSYVGLRGLHRARRIPRS
jgi:AraC-like DNA-binding protein